MFILIHGFLYLFSILLDHLVFGHELLLQKLKILLVDVDFLVINDKLFIDVLEPDDFVVVGLCLCAQLLDSCVVDRLLDFLNLLIFKAQMLLRVFDQVLDAVYLL